MKYEEEWYDVITTFRRYDPETGLWYDGDTCLNADRKHRFTFTVAGLSMLSTHWAWLYMTGEWPREGMVIDHIDRNPANDKWDNLRMVTQSDNCYNRKWCSPHHQVSKEFIERFNNSVPVWGGGLRQ